MDIQILQEIFIYSLLQIAPKEFLPTDRTEQGKKKNFIIKKLKYCSGSRPDFPHGYLLIK